MHRLHDLDFEHPDVPVGNMARPHITYEIARPRGKSHPSTGSE
jgi:hypothetical protein